MKHLYKHITTTVALMLLSYLTLFAQAPTITVSGDINIGYYLSDEDYVINFQVTDPNTEEAVALAITSTNLEDYSFSPVLPVSGIGTISSQLQISFGGERGPFYRYLTLTATDAAGHSSETTLYFMVTPRPQIIVPTDTVIVCINQPIYITFNWSEGEQSGTYWPGRSGHPFGEPFPDFVGISAFLEEDYAREEDLGTYRLGLAVLDYESGIRIYNEDVIVKVVDCSKETWAWDDDRDGFGDRPYDNTYQFNYTTQEYPAVVNNNLDCNDKDANINPEAEEVAGDGIDNNCNGEVDEADVCMALKGLHLTAECSNIASSRLWQIYNPNTCSVEVEWWVHKTNQKGKIVATPGYSTFTTTSIGKNDVAFISCLDAEGNNKKHGMASSSAKCHKNKYARTTAIDNSVGPENLQVYPVPFSNNFQLSYQDISANSKLKITLTSVDGKQFDISSNIIRKTEGSITLNLESTGVAKGLYILQLHVDDQAPVLVRVIKQ